MPDELPGALRATLDRARELTFYEARQLSSLYDRGPGTPGDRARKSADAAAKSNGLSDQRVAWLREAGNAVIEAQVADPWDPTHGEPWRWATQTVLDVARATLVQQFIEPADYELLVGPWTTVIINRAGPDLERRK